MSRISKKTIDAIVMENIPRNVLMALDESMLVGAQRACDVVKHMDKGHYSSALGQARHFYMNESFHNTLEVAGASPSPLSGNKIVTGKLGIFTIARFNEKLGARNNRLRSKTRRAMSLINAAMEPIVQPSLFSDYVEPTKAVLFIVTYFAESKYGHFNTPASVEIVVPDSSMQRDLLREKIEVFAKRYYELGVAQQDNAMPKLKNNIRNIKDNDGTHS